MRSFLRYVNIPPLTSADVIVHAELSLYRHGGSVSPLPIEAHKVLGYWDSQTITWDTQPEYNPIIEDYCQVGGTNRYSWEITDIVKDWYKGGSSESNTGVMLKAPDSVENGTTNFWKKFYTIDYDEYEQSICPQMYIYCKNNNGIESYWDYTTSSAGRAGTGYVNNYSGNLTWIHNDIGFGGNRMPVSISHVYNTNDSADNNLGLGYGWQTNFNQTVYQWKNKNEIMHYVWEDGDGTKHYFEPNPDGTYKDEDGLELTLTVSGNTVTIVDKNENSSCFTLYKEEDTLKYFRLYTLTNYQETPSSITIIYSAPSSLLISTVTDGVDRKYNFTYTGDLLSRISYVGKVEEGQTDPEEISYVTFGYTGSNLTSITDKDGKSSIFTYGTNNLLTTAQDVDGYKLQYTYSDGLPKRVVGINEYDGTAAGGYMTVEYAHNQTTFTDHNNNVQILQFNDWGNLIAIQDDQGRAQYAQYARNEYKDEDTSKANQMSLSSKMQNTVSNLHSNSSFEESSMWSASTSSVTVSRSTEAAYLGNYSLKLVGTETSTRIGAYSQPLSVGPGETITVSAYIKTGDASAALGIERQRDYVVFDGEVVAAKKDWGRYQVSYTNNSSTAEIVHCYIFVRSSGAVYMDCVQAELASTASRYNLLDNGNFHYGDYAWTKGNGMTSEDTYSEKTPPIPELGASVYSITGSPTGEKYLSQTLNISGSAKDSYVLSGWAKGDSVPLNDESRKFGLELLFYHNNVLQETHSVSFNADCSSAAHWQYAAAPIVPETDYDKIVVRICYCNNANTVYFDGIQLFKETFGTSYTYDGNGNVTSVVDLQNETTTYEYENNNLTQIIQGNKAKMEYEYDDWHNVTKAITQKEDANGNIVDGIVYEFAYDAYGNNTLVKIVNGEQCISSSATYTPDGNRLLTTKDDLENITTFCYNEDTNVLEWVQYPNDTAASRTTYAYDDMYRVATASAAVSGLSEGTALTASYTYTNDQVTAIQTGSTTYSFTYGDFGLRTGVRIGNRQLATYEYTADANRYLDKLTYGNGDYTEYVYDDQGRVTRETFEDNHTVSYEYDNTGALSTVTDSATGRKTTYYYDLIDRLGKYREIGPDFEHSVTYTYDERNNLSKLDETINGATQTTRYSYDYENRLIETRYNYLAKGKNVIESITYDNYGRMQSVGIGEAEIGETKTVVFDTWFGYQDGKSANSATTKLRTMVHLSSLYHSVGSVYEYDGQGNITKYTASIAHDFDYDPYFDTLTRQGDSYYHYDTANQLVREDNAWLGKTFVWTYDNAGNITSRKEYAYTDSDSAVSGTPTATYAYTYGDSTWGDLLTAYNGAARTYDQIGNLLTDGTWTYTWRNGRELAGMTDGSTTWNYTYDANGMRTSRTNGTKTYNYVYNGSQLTQMTVGNDTLYFTYGVLGPATVTWNGTTYYFALNAQGDVVGIYDNTGYVVVTYNWDTAWGNNPIPQGSLASTLGALNPLRYRAYVYDTETGCYYLQSRYYDPEIGRFINADGLIATGQGLLGNNMFAYCLNNPVNLKDPTGDVAITTLILIGSGIVGAAFAGYTAYKEYQAGYDTVRIVGDSICAGFAAFSIAYTGGMSLYQCYQHYCYLNAITPVTEIGAKSAEQQLQTCANTANNSVSGTGAVTGTKKHTIFAAEVNKLGNSNFRTEVSYLDGDEVPYGTKGSVRFDVVQYDNGVPVHAWDFKTGAATLTSTRITYMQLRSGYGSLPISMIK